MRAQPQMAASRFVFLDETGTNIAMTRRYARSPRGQRVYGSVPHSTPPRWGERGKNLTVVGAISREGVLCHRALDGGMSGVAFLTFQREVLVPALKPGQVVVMDNLTSHKTKAVRAAFAAARVEVLYLPRYAPELNPIELCWSKVKARLRAVSARTREHLRAAVEEALGMVSAAEAGRWIRHCGYQLAIT